MAHTAFRRFGSFVLVNGLVAGALVFGALESVARAAHPSETLLPAGTKGFLATNNVEEVREKFRQTQLGELVNDPVMKPFIDDLKEQIGAKLEKAGKRMGLKWADMEGVYGGEVALAIVQPDAKDKSSHATVLLVDITGKRDKADALLAKVDANQKANRATRSALKAGGVDMVVYTQPLAAGAPAAGCARRRCEGGRKGLLLHQGRSARCDRPPGRGHRDCRAVRRRGCALAGLGRSVPGCHEAQYRRGGRHAAAGPMVCRALRLCRGEPGHSGRAAETRQRHAQDSEGPGLRGDWGRRRLHLLRHGQ